MSLTARSSPSPVVELRPRHNALYDVNDECMIATTGSCRTQEIDAERWAARAARHGYGEVVETVALGALGEKLLAEARSASSGRCSVTIHGGHVNR